MLFEGNSFGISNLNTITIDILLIDVILHNEEIEERKQCICNYILNKM